MVDPVCHMENKGVLVRLRGIRTSLKWAEKKVADHILKEPIKIQNQTVAETANDSGVSEATVIRFCRTLGFKGFADFKIQLARESGEPFHFMGVEEKEILGSDSPRGIMEKVFQFNISTLRETLEVLDPKSLEKAVNILDKAGKVLIIGVGTSAANVQDAHNKFFRIGINSVAQPDAHLQMMEASLLSSGDVVLAITHSGRTRDPVETLQVAKKAGAKAIVITSNPRSPITSQADVVLLTSSSETRFRAEALASRLAQMSIVDTLHTMLAIKNRRRALASTKKIELVIGQKQIH